MKKFQNNTKAIFTGEKNSLCTKFFRNISSCPEIYLFINYFIYHKLLFLHIVLFLFVNTKMLEIYEHFFISSGFLNYLKKVVSFKDN